MSRIPSLAAVLVLALALVAGRAAAQGVSCTEAAGLPGAETVVTVEIVEPAPGALVPAAGGCGTSVTVSGRWSVTAPPLPHDIYIVIDESGSTAADSGADVDGDGVLGEAADDILRAEIAAARAYVSALDPALARVAVIAFNRDAQVRHALSADLPSVLATLDAMRADRARWGTAYVPAMAAVQAEVLARGDRPARRQRCVFLSDGAPDESLAQTDAAALSLAGLDVVMDTLALGAIDSAALQGMAMVTGGTFTALATPGDVVALLPSLVPEAALAFHARNPDSGADEPIVPAADGTFTVEVPLATGSNHVVVELTADAGTPVTVTCAIDLDLAPGLLADAGADAPACAGRVVLLDGRASVAACADAAYRWLDCAGGVACDWSADPTCAVEACACEDYVLEVACPAEGCAASDAVRVTCLAVAPPAPALVAACGLEATLSCGIADLPAGLEAAWDLDAFADSDGNGGLADDADAPGCDVTVAFARPGSQQVAAIVSEPASGCVASAPLQVHVRPLPPPRPLDGGACPGSAVVLTCGTSAPDLTHAWDLDAAIDADLDGDPTNDLDGLGCEVVASWGEGAHLVHGWTTDGWGCRWLAATGTITIEAGARPGEVTDLRVERERGDLVASWIGVPGADAYRVLRGPLSALWTDRAYDHAADDAAGRGACRVASAELRDPDDLALPEDAYYLVVAVNPCGGEGHAGEGWTRSGPISRPGRIPTGSCP